ncbi:MAG: hemolysin [Cenarchaeum symbiont of Oopsacas minuta]|nr:hemolysin [Cenarchaeum symbiont of Oopsacas minuta]
MDYLVDIWVEILLLAVLIALSGFFSGLEVALVGTSKSKVMQMLIKNVKGSKALHKLKSNPGWMMSSVNLGNNMVNVAASAIATSISIRFFDSNGLAIAIGLMTFLILVFGEITPKTYCNANATKIALRFSPVLLVFGYALYPIVKIFEWITRAMVRLTGSRYAPPPITEDEIKDVVDLGLAEKAIEEDERRMVHGALEFDDTPVRTVMIPRLKMFMLNSKVLLFEALHDINQSGHSRIPIFDENQDNIVGFVHVRDMLKQMEDGEKMVTLAQIAREPVFVSQEKTVAALLKEMRGRKVHMAIVIDEHGGVEGLVTLEDLLEEIVGEIEDESDKTPQVQYTKIDDDTIIANGSMEIDAINEIFNTSIAKGVDYATLNGLLHEKLKDIPQEGDKIHEGSLRIVVEKVSGNIPERVKIERRS